MPDCCQVDRRSQPSGNPSDCAGQLAGGPNAHDPAPWHAARRRTGVAGTAFQSQRRPSCRRKRQGRYVRSSRCQRQDQPAGPSAHRSAAAVSERSPFQHRSQTARFPKLELGQRGAASAVGVATLLWLARRSRLSASGCAVATTSLTGPLRRLQCCQRQACGGEARSLCGLPTRAAFLRPTPPESNGRSRQVARSPQRQATAGPSTARQLARRRRRRAKENVELVAARGSRDCRRSRQAEPRTQCPNRRRN